MKKTLLFVTYHDEDWCAGLSYAIYLAKTMNKDMTVLLVDKRNLADRFADVMTSVAFAEAGEHETARRIYADCEVKDRTDRKTSFLAERCRGAGVDLCVQSSAGDIVRAVKYYLSDKTSVDMVLLSPSIIDRWNVTEEDLRKLINRASMPIVMMARQGRLSSARSCPKMS